MPPAQGVWRALSPLSCNLHATRSSRFPCSLALALNGTGLHRLSGSSLYVSHSPCSSERALSLSLPAICDILFALWLQGSVHPYTDDLTPLLAAILCQLLYNSQQWTIHEAMKTHLVGSAGWRQIVFSLQHPRTLRAVFFPSA